MRTLACAVAAAVLLAGAPAALAHQGDPNYLSEVNAVTPATDGLTVEVLNRDDRLLLTNRSSETVTIEGYAKEPYARIGADGRVEVNRNSEAAYINEERDGQVDVPSGVGPDAAPRWEVVGETGRFEWHDHRMHWMGEDRPDAVAGADVRTKVFDYEIPIAVGERRGAIAGTLFWTPQEGGGLPLAAILAFAGLVIVLAAGVTVVRRRRAGGVPEEAW